MYDRYNSFFHGLFYPISFYLPMISSILPLLFPASSLMPLGPQKFNLTGWQRSIVFRLDQLRKHLRSNDEEWVLTKVIKKVWRLSIKEWSHYFKTTWWICIKQHSQLLQSKSWWCCKRKLWSCLQVQRTSEYEDKFAVRSAQNNSVLLYPHFIAHNYWMDVTIDPT